MSDSLDADDKELLATILNDSVDFYSGEDDCEKIVERIKSICSKLGLPPVDNG